MSKQILSVLNLIIGTQRFLKSIIVSDDKIASHIRANDAWIETRKNKSENTINLLMESKH